MTTALLVLLFTNALRQQPLILDADLSRRAQVRAEQLCTDQQWSHAGFEKNMTGYYYFGENLARHFPDVYSAFSAWIVSPSHRANLLNTHYTRTGVGEDKRCALIVQLFAGI